MLLNSRKKLLSAFIAAMMLFTLIVPTAISLAGTSRTNGKPFAAEQSGGTVVNSSDDEQWIYLKRAKPSSQALTTGLPLPQIPTFGSMQKPVLKANR